MKDDPVFYVPEVIESLSRKQVLTTELVSGVSLDKLMTADQDTRSWVGGHCLQVVYITHDGLTIVVCLYYSQNHVPDHH